MSSNTTMPPGGPGWPVAPSTTGDSVDYVRREAVLEDLMALECEEAATYARRLQAVQRLRVKAEAEYRAAHPDPPGVHRSIPDSVYADVVAEICAVRHVGRRQVEAELAEASRVIEHLPGMFEMMLDGLVGQRHARAIADESAPLIEADLAAAAAYERARNRRDVSPEARAKLREAAIAAAAAVVEYENVALESSEGRTAASLRDRCHKLAARLLGRGAEARKQAARATRRVWMRDVGNGMSELSAVLASDIAAGIFDRLTEQSAALTRANREVTEAAAGVPPAVPDDRTFEQVRADVFADLLLTSEPSAVHASARGIDATVAITLPALTLLGVDVEPATLNGASPIALDEAKRYAAKAPSWLRILTDPVTGVAREVETYRPTAAQRALVGARDVSCRFPGCRRPARRCDIDHARAWAEGGPTAVENLESLCRWHHSLKHSTAWDVRHDPERAGDLIWTAPSGREYSDYAPPIGPIFTKTDLVKLRGPAPPAPF